ncbi:MAG: hypothetical protein Q8P06_01825 [Candidatus Azambacteria bacterium]|nr:hypothetical protein [Candidatus Azambacteria bacterium]
MAATKNILRSFIVLMVVLGVGFFGLWLLRENEIQVINQNSTAPSAFQNDNTDQFSAIGGKTPQETLNLLIKNLEKNDLTAAIQYFVPENRATESEDLTKLYNANILGDLIKDLKNIKDGKMIANNQYRFEIPDDAGGVAVEIDLMKNNKGFWEIVSL